MKPFFWGTYSSQVYANVHVYYRSSFAMAMMLCNSILQRRSVCQQQETDRDTPHRLQSCTLPSCPHKCTSAYHNPITISELLPYVAASSLCFCRLSCILYEWRNPTRKRRTGDCSQGVPGGERWTTSRVLVLR